MLHAETELMDATAVQAVPNLSVALCGSCALSDLVWYIH